MNKKEHLEALIRSVDHVAELVNTLYKLEQMTYINADPEDAETYAYISRIVESWKREISQHTRLLIIQIQEAKNHD